MQHRNLIQILFLASLGLGALTAACNLPLLHGLGGGGPAPSRQSSTSTTSETHTVNGHPVDADGDREGVDEDRDRASRDDGRSSTDDGGAIGATCQHNSDCASDACWVGKGDLGYCTRMCDDFTDCPKFWECEKPGNAPQRICKQESDSDSDW